MQQLFQEVDECIIVPEFSPEQQFEDFMKQLNQISCQLQKKQDIKNNNCKNSMYQTNKLKQKSQICQQNISKNNSQKLKCEHKYHKNCFNALQYCIKCPLCRFPTK